MGQLYSCKNDFINALGGSDVLVDVILKRGILKLIDKHLGIRGPRAEYTYGEGILLWFISMCRGAKRMENVYQHKESFTRHPRFKKFISPDTLLYMFKELAVKNDYYKKLGKGETRNRRVGEICHVKNPRKDEIRELHETNWNKRLNEMLVDSALKLGLLKKNVGYVLDYDTTIINNKIRGSKSHYEKRTGYNPAIALINKIPLIIENRNGDSSPAFKLAETVGEIIDILIKKGITIDYVRIDGAAHSEYFTDMINKKKLKYITRPKSVTTDNSSQDVFNWRRYDINNRNCLIGDAPFRIGKYDNRIVITKKPDDTLWGLITNEMYLSKAEIVKLYNKRGDAENMFKDLKRDFGWTVMPMRDVSNNTVYLCIQAFCYQLFTYITRLFSGVSDFVRNNMRLLTFLNNFIRVPTMWNGEELIFLATDKDYSGLAGFT